MIAPDRGCSRTTEDYADLPKESSFPHGVEDNRFIVLRNHFYGASVDEVHLENTQ